MRLHKRLLTGIRITRAPFFTAVILPSVLGALVAWRAGSFHLGLMLLTTAGVVLVNAGLNLSNDYFDHLSGNDAANRSPTPFSGGSRAIQEGLISPDRMLRWSLTFYGLGIAIGIYLAVARGWPVLLFGVVGLFLAFFHNAPPVRLYNLAPGVGEFASGIGCGPLIVLGSYYVQTQRLSWEAVSASLPLGLLITAVLYINEFPDREADQAVGKKTLPVVLGTRGALPGYVGLMVASYVVLLAGIVGGIFPWPALLALLTVPLAAQAVRGARQFHGDSLALIPAMAATVQTHLAAGISLCAAYILGGLL
jgi:1,4-dihydroxy-2-naphthoate octaprenyltransferase